MKKINLFLTVLAITGASVASNPTYAVPSYPSVNEVQAVQDENDITTAIVTRTDVSLAFVNDETYPWTIVDNTVKNGNCGKANSTSTLTMTFRSTYKTELSFDWLCRNYSSHSLAVFIDDVQKGSTTTNSYQSFRLYLDAGEHVIVFKDVISGNTTTTNNYSYIKNVTVKEISPLEETILTENSMPLTFINDEKWPWTFEDGYIQNGNWSQEKTASRLKTTFTIDKTSRFSFEIAIPSYDDFYSNGSYVSRHRFEMYVNDIQIDYWEAKRDWTYFAIALEPGTYTIELIDTLKSSSGYYARLRNIELSNNWQTVELATSGTLGFEALSLPAFDVLTDVEFLKIVGPLNSADWTDIMNMTNLKALDLSEAVINEIPNNAFDGKGWLNSVILPEGITKIGDFAFRGTSIRRINIPSTVTTINQYAFISTPLQYLTFTENCQLKTIGRYAFQKCASLQEVILPDQVKSIGYCAFDLCTSVKRVEMPNTVTSLGAYAFASEYELKSIRFSDGLTELIEWVCVEDHALTEVHLPANLTRICHDAFYNTYNLHEIDFPSTLKEIDYGAFRYSALESVNLPINLQWLGTDAFSNNSNLKHIEFPSYLERGVYSYRSGYWDDGNDWSTYSSSSGYRSNFNSCPNIETIVMRAATPPAIDADPFESSRAKGDITLVVPSFSVVNYKLDTYWYQFGNIIEGDDVDYWKITSPLMLTNNRRMQGKPDVDLYYGGQLTVGGNAPMEMGQFNLYVNESNPGRLLNTCENVSADAATTKFSVEANKWYFFTPLHDVAISAITVSNNASYVFRYYDSQNRADNGTGASWKNVDTDKLLAGQGYIFHCNAACVITMPADAAGQAQMFRTTDATKTLLSYEATSTANRSWNYVGNPYPTYYDIYYINFSAPITVWTGSTYQAYSIADDEFVLRPMQSFFVQKPDGTETINFGKEGRQLLSTVQRAGTRHKENNQNRCLFNLQIDGNDNSDRTRVVINNDASLSYEINCDAAKFMSLDAAIPQIYTTDQEGNSYAINERPLGNGQVELAFYAGQEGFYTIKALRADGTILLRDHQEDKTVNISNEGYTFHTEATPVANNKRFTLTLSTSGESTGIKSKNLNPSADNNYYDLQGRKVSTLKKGIYIKNGQKVVNK